MTLYVSTGSPFRCWCSMSSNTVVNFVIIIRRAHTHVFPIIIGKQDHRVLRARAWFASFGCCPKLPSLDIRSVWWDTGYGHNAGLIVHTSSARNRQISRAASANNELRTHLATRNKNKGWCLMITVLLCAVFLSSSFSSSALWLLK